MTQLNGYRKMMIEQGGNLGWCKPISYNDGGVILALNEGQIVGLQMDGADLDKIDNATLETVARRVNPDYADYSGWSLQHIILDANGEELPCCRCPWFGVCDAMDDPDGWEED